MKKITTITAIALLAISAVSCSKSSYSELTGQGTSSQAVIPKPEVFAVSEWVYPNSFSIETDRLGSIFIKGLYSFSASTQLIYDQSSHVKLAYARIPGNSRSPYIKLPFKTTVTINRISSDVHIDHSLDPDGFKVYFKNADYSFLNKAVEQTAAENWKFRYIVISKSTYETTTVDWNDLSAVAAALNFTL